MNGAKMETFSGVLRKPIDLHMAPARGIKAAFVLPPDEADLIYYANTEWMARWHAFDEFSELNSSATDIWERRAKALVERRFGIDPSDPIWWQKLANSLVKGHVPGFSFRKPSKKPHGTPLRWTNEKLMELRADVEYLKIVTKKSAQYICARLPRANGYTKRWGDCTAEGLR